MAHPSIFYDASGRRSRWLLRASVVGGAVLLVIAGIFTASLVLLPALSIGGALPLGLRQALRPRIAGLPQRDERRSRFLQERARDRLLKRIAGDEAAHRSRTPAKAKQAPDIVAAFYATWQETGIHSLRANAGHLTHLLPVWLHLSADGSRLDLSDWDTLVTPHNRDVAQIARDSGLVVMPVLSNGVGDSFDSVRVHRLLVSPALQRGLARQLRGWLGANRYAGVNIDFENLGPADYHALPELLLTLRRTLAPAGLQVSVDVETGVPSSLWRSLAAGCDFVILMAYDQHYSGGPPGPIAGMAWYRAALAAGQHQIPRDKLVVGLGNYAYDWTGNERGAEDLTYQDALILARDNSPDADPEAMIRFDPVALNSTFSYQDESGSPHEVWMLDGPSAANEWKLAQGGARGAALWVLGSEDPSVWSFLDRKLGRAPPDMTALRSVTFPYGVEFEGAGEILKMAASPQAGSREIQVDAGSGLCVNETYRSFPSSYVIRRTGYAKGVLALTFDDGPSDPYTGQMVAALQSLGVPGAFFVVGQNAERYPGEISRLWHAGFEIGNHTFTHPNLAAVSAERTQLELNATQRIIQSEVGRSTLLFRPPYNADAEPASAEEVIPIALASRMGYATVGEYVDPQDWNLRVFLPDGTVVPRNAEEIAADVMQQVRAGAGNIILLHDGGGDRSRTVAALRIFVPRLQKEGFRFVSVSSLLGKTRDQIMPPISRRDLLLLGGDRTVFELAFLLEWFFHAAFLAAIGLGTLRVLWITTLAVIARRRESKSRGRPAPSPRVSVLMAAYNEERVIGRSITALLESGYPALEVIVVDDGSQDATAAVVDDLFKDDVRVRVLRQANAGKAAALNHGMSAAAGEVLVCLDADTLMAPDAIALLAAHFADPRVGAVAGNVKVGNRTNLWTYWQAIEYIDSQNLERRAYSMLNAVAVVPGAAGAWRREAIAGVGGYATDTLAEDMDLTWRVRRAGWRVNNEPLALAFTEVPETLPALFKQRFRWAYGTLQCLWKHRDAVGRYGWFGRMLLPSLWIFQFLFQALSPVIDFAVAWTLCSVTCTWLTRGLMAHEWQPIAQAVSQLSEVGFLYAFFFLLELGSSLIAFRMDREPRRLLKWLFWQRFVYRQLMYAVVLKSLRMAAHGFRAGWGKLERRGTARASAA